ncbi:kinase-like domain-containing protein [Phakopsora pachyrhizi]|uniref:Kinase-like domain-containing protein n=1 Tax=Phakopsora pachyrhizi TaxID=170000 RepID=A0AAV0BHJ6_PHAPC|nr:kinase-like domain-containing protein [Phakopsora pachyrhizi]CAH7685766.1 kinase-like domain-containing protein [Phakopsora pachyrhizi]
MLLGQAKKNRNKKGLALGSNSSSSLGLGSDGTTGSSIDRALGLNNSSDPSTTSTVPRIRSNLSVTTNQSSSSVSTLNQSASSTLQLSQSGLYNPSSSSSNRMDYHNKLSEQLATLEIGLEFKLDLHSEDLQLLGDLGAGNGGTVCKALHVPTKLVMARKLVHIDAKPSVRRQILRELQIMHDCRSPHIVSFYGAYLQDPHICMCMEFMDKTSLDNIYKKTGPIPENVLGKITVAVVSGLNYLYDAHRIIHRDVKPSNVLFNSQGQVKICDFGVSGELINSIADTFVGTSTYMSPERIQGAQYTVKSDVWSLGITLIELALGRFPFSEDSESDNSRSSGEEEDGNELTLSPARPGNQVQQSLEAAMEAQEEKDRIRLERRKARREQRALEGGSGSGKSENGNKKKAPNGVSLEGGGAQMSILELLQHVVNEPAPKLPSDRFSKQTCDFIDACLLKDHDSRPTPKMLTEFDWYKSGSSNEVDLVLWASTLKL